MRWDVEFAPQAFHDVGAARLEVSSGSLVFYDESDNILMAYAQSAWITVALTEQ